MRTATRTPPTARLLVRTTSAKNPAKTSPVSMTAHHQAVPNQYVDGVTGALGQTVPKSAVDVKSAQDLASVLQTLAVSPIA
jgi:hypothetical protein